MRQGKACEALKFFIMVTECFDVRINNHCILRCVKTWNSVRPHESISLINVERIRSNSKHIMTGNTLISPSLSVSANLSLYLFLSLWFSFYFYVSVSLVVSVSLSLLLSICLYFSVSLFLSLCSGGDWSQEIMHASQVSSTLVSYTEWRLQ